MFFKTIVTKPTHLCTFSLVLYYISNEDSRKEHKEIRMKYEKGFLLIELMIGLLVSTLCMIIITHYIIEVKCSQQKALEKIESFSTARNEIENSAIDCTKNISGK